MNADTGTVPNEKEIERLRKVVKALQADENLSLKDIANESGIPPGTLSPWLDNTYGGNNANVALRVQGWLDTRERSQLLQSTVPNVPDFRMTETSKRIIDAMEMAHLVGDIIVVGMGPGLGKTSSITQYEATRPLVFVATMTPATRGVNTMLSTLCKAVGETDNKGTPALLSDRVIARVRDKRALIVIDEAQHLSEQAFEQIRAIHDTTGVGIAMLGNEDLYSMLDGTGRKSSFSQLTSRIGCRIRQSSATERDLEIIASAWDVEDEIVLAFIKKIGAYPGALRGVTKTLRLANFLSPDDEMSLQTLRAAWSRVGSGVAGGA
ncbi:MAG: AAA family ATPase [Pseudomonadota bacterium]